MIVLILIAAFMLTSYGVLTWKENRTVEPEERMLHFGFRVGPLFALGLLALAGALGGCASYTGYDDDVVYPPIYVKPHSAQYIDSDNVDRYVCVDSFKVIERWSTMSRRVRLRCMVGRL